MNEEQPESEVESHESQLMDIVSSESQVSSEIRTALLCHHTQEEKKGVSSSSIEYVSCIVHLAVFGILGVITRYLLQKLFGPNMANVTSDQSILYLDLPSNVIGSFLMGWLGVVFKADITRVSDQLAGGLSTGYLGSLTTFSGWNQKMLQLSLNGKWLLAILGFIVGFLLCACSIILGVKTAKGFRWVLSTVKKGSNTGEKRSRCLMHSHLTVFSILVLVWGGLWATSGILLQKEFENGGSSAQLWVALLVAPFGVWIRWLLGFLNAPAVGGEARLFEWIPFGTLVANVSASCIMAALATMKKAVNTQKCDTIATGIQLGLMGSLSTVSTLMAEFYAMTQSSEPWKGYAYVALTILISFGFGTLLYSVPLWTHQW